MPRKDEPRTVVRWSVAEFADLCAAAERAGLPLATYVRRAAMGAARGLHELAPAGPLARLDDAVMGRLGLSPAAARRAIRVGLVQVNGIVVRDVVHQVAPDAVLVVDPAADRR